MCECHAKLVIVDNLSTTYLAEIIPGSNQTEPKILILKFNTLNKEEAEIKSVLTGDTRLLEVVSGIGCHGRSSIPLTLSLSTEKSSSKLLQRFAHINARDNNNFVLNIHKTND